MTDSDSCDMRSTVRTTVVSLTVAVALWLLGRGTLSTPPVGSWTDLQRWLGDRSTAVAAISAVRAVAVVTAGYLGGISGLTIAAKFVSSEPLDRLARGLLPRSIRPLIGLAVGAGVVTAAASMTVPRDRAPARVATVTLAAPSDATATMYVVSESVVPTSITASTVASTTVTTPTITAATIPVIVAQPIPAPAPTAEVAVAAHTWTIAPGEHLWAVASETLADAWHRAPSESEVVPYWRELIEINRSRLIDSNNPDFVLAGQTFVLPNIPASPK